MGIRHTACQGIATNGRAYLASFLLVNLLYWLYVLLKMRGRDTALHRKYEAERLRRDDAAAALAEKKGRRSRTSASLA